MIIPIDRHKQEKSGVFVALYRPYPRNGYGWKACLLLVVPRGGGQYVCDLVQMGRQRWLEVVGPEVLGPNVPGVPMAEALAAVDEYLKDHGHGK